MKEFIKVECTDAFTITNNVETEVLAEVEEVIYIAKSNEETEEYFSIDAKGREFLVGEIDVDGKLALQEGFKLLAE